MQVKKPLRHAKSVYFIFLGIKNCYYKSIELKIHLFVLFIGGLVMEPTTVKKIIIDSSIKDMAKPQENSKGGGKKAETRFWQVRTVTVSTDKSSEEAAFVVKDMGFIRWAFYSLFNYFFKEKLVQGNDLKNLYTYIQNTTEYAQSIKDLVGGILGNAAKPTQLCQIELRDHTAFSRKSKNELIYFQSNVLEDTSGDDISIAKFETKVNWWTYQNWSAEEVKKHIECEEISLDEAVSLTCNYASGGLFEDHLNMFIKDFNLDINEVPSKGYPEFSTVLYRGQKIDSTPFMQSCLRHSPRDLSELEFMLEKGAKLSNTQYLGLTGCLKEKKKNESQNTKSDLIDQIEQILNLIENRKQDIVTE